MQLRIDNKIQLIDSKYVRHNHIRRVFFTIRIALSSILCAYINRKTNMQAAN